MKLYLSFTHNKNKIKTWLKTCEKIRWQTEIKKKKKTKFKQVSNFNLKGWKKLRNENENENMYQTNPKIQVDF